MLQLRGHLKKGSECEFLEIFSGGASDCELLRGPSDCELGPAVSSASQWSPKEVDCELVSVFVVRSCGLCDRFSLPLATISSGLKTHWNGRRP